MIRTFGTASGTAALTTLVAAVPVSAHGLTGRYESPLPLAVYVAGAALAVALSFAIAFVHRGRWHPQAREEVRRVPRPVILSLRVVGLVAWGWIMAQLVVGGTSDGEVATLFTWVYGWVGLAIVSALLGPVWEWLDPFRTLHDIGAAAARRLGIGAGPTVTYPARLASWPAVGGFAFFVWLELAYRRADMGVVVLAYTLLTLAGMAVFGRDTWRARGEVFSVWFGLLNRLARYGPADTSGSGAVRRQQFPDGLLAHRWDASLVAVVAVATGAILFDGLSQTELYFDLFGLPDLARSTILLVLFLAAIAAIALVVGRRVGYTAMGAGLLPISVGYLIAHYLTYLLGDGQRILIAVSDPFQLGWDLFGTVFHQPSTEWLAPSVLWSIIFVAVVGGHVLGAWAGHLGDGTTPDSPGRPRGAQLPLAMTMVLLTTVTLWSLGQTVITDPADEASARIPTLHLGPGTGRGA